MRIGQLSFAEGGKAAGIARDRRGAVAIEFALLAIPLFMLLFGILETGLIFFGSSMLERATADAARLVRTGQAQGNNMTATQYHDYICGEISVLLSCGANLQVDVEAYSNFNSVVISNPIVGGRLDPNLNKFNVGLSGNIVLVRTFYTWDILTPILRPFFGNLANGQRLMTSTAAFRNEPFRGLHMRTLRLLRAKDGTVAVEFAFIAPVLILLLLGSVELCYALICREKVATVAASASDLVAQDDTITGAQMTDVFTAINTILYPYPSTGTSVVITSIKQDPNHAGQYVVDWSVPYNTTGHTKGASITVPAGLVTSGGSVILAEVSYSYVPPFTQGITGGFTMTDTFYSRPRKSTFVVYNP